MQTGVQGNQPIIPTSAGSLKRLHLLIIGACALGFSFDLAEIAFGSILAAVFSSPPYAADKTEISWLLSAVYIGAIAGAPLFGWLADRHGRRIGLTSVMATLALASVGAAFAPDVGWLVAFRMLSGLALGAYPPLMFSYLSDILPAAQRGKLVMVATAFGYAGPTIFIFLVRWLTPIAPLGFDAWRWGFLFGGAGAAVCSFLFYRLPESGPWLMSKGRDAQANVTARAFEASRPVSRFKHLPSVPKSISTEDDQFRTDRFVVGFLVLVFFLTPWATVGFTLLSGAVLVQKGINLQDSLLYLGISTLGPIVGTIVGGYFIDKVQRRTALIASATAMALIGLLFATTTVPMWLIGCGIAFNLLVSLFLPVLFLYAAEMVPNSRRGMTTSFAWSANRIGSALTPLVLLPVLQLHGAYAMFTVIAGTLVLFIGLVLGWGPPGRAGRQLK
jgi:putative MFS transporter